MKYDDARWQWWVSPDEERWDGPHKTKQEAIDHALAEQMYTELDPDPEGGHPEWRVQFYIQEGVSPTVADMRINGGETLDMLEDHYEEWAYEDNLFAGVQSDQMKELGNALTEALHLWAQCHQIEFKFWCFAESRNEEIIELPHPLNKST